jgi:hypothetical protein
MPLQAAQSPTATVVRPPIAASDAKPAAIARSSAASDSPHAAIQLDASHSHESSPAAENEVIFFSLSERPTGPPSADISKTGSGVEPRIEVAFSEPAPAGESLAPLVIRVPAEAEIVVSMSEPAPSAAPPAAAIRKAPPRLPRRDPLAPAPHVAAGDVAEARATRRVRNPLDAAVPWTAAPQTSFESSSLTSEAPSTRRRAPVFYALAAVGCAALLFRWMSGAPADPVGGAAAMGALKPVANAPETLDLVASERVASPPASEPLSPPVAATPQGALARSLPNSAPRIARPGDPPAVSPTPGGAQALVEEGTALLKQGRLGLAESSYQKALQASPEYPNAIVGLVRVHLARRDGAEAVRWASLLVSKQPSNGVNQLLLGDAQALYGDQDAARAAWTAAARSGNALARQRLQ